MAVFVILVASVQQFVQRVSTPTGPTSGAPVRSPTPWDFRAASDGVVSASRMALDPGRDERAVPIRSRVLGRGARRRRGHGRGRVRGVAEQPGRHAASLRMDLGHQDQDPTTPTHCGRDTFDIDRQPDTVGITDIAALCYHGFDVDGRNTVVWGYTQVRGRSTAGRSSPGVRRSAATTRSLGLDTMNALDKHIGDTVRIADGPAGHGSPSSAGRCSRR